MIEPALSSQSSWADLSMGGLLALGLVDMRYD